MSAPSSSDPIFSPSLLPADSTTTLPATYKVRPLERGDYSRGFLDCLADLTWIGDCGEEDFYERYDWLATKGKDWYYCLVVDDGARIVATATLIVERKFIQNRNLVGHVEEVVVLKSERGKGLGVAVVQALNAVARNVGVGKVVLNCSDHNVEFYQRCGYEKSGLEMKLTLLSHDA